MSTNNNNHHALVQKVWHYAHVLRDQGISYGDYIEQITYLLFLKMDQEREDLLEKNASEAHSGAGQYFTPRPVIQAMVECIAPKIGETVVDPACGTGGFLLAAYDHMKGQTKDRDKLAGLRNEAFTGIDIVDEVVRLCAMNLYLHGLGNGGSPVHQGDALSSAGTDRYDIVLTNPPFGKKSSYRVVGEDGQVTTEQENYEREDFKFTTSNKQFNFLQHIMTILKVGGRAGVVHYRSNHAPLRCKQPA